MRGSIVVLGLFLQLKMVWASFEDGAPSGHYETYVFAMEWQPTWSQPPDCSPTLAAHLTPGAFAGGHLSTHGLWPNYDPDFHDGASWPQFCVRPDGRTFTDCEADYSSHPFCTPSDAAKVFNTSVAWQTYSLEYAWSDLASHEWSKHGSCTNWSSPEYFAQVEAMYLKMAVGSGAAYVSASVGSTVSMDDLQAAFQLDTGGKKVAFNCDAACNLAEVWTAWGADPATLEPTASLDYAGAPPCSPDACPLGLAVPAWAPVDGGCPPVPAPDPNNATVCASGVHGPICPDGDLDCASVPGCLRCASSGYCTDVPLSVPLSAL